MTTFLIGLLALAAFFLGRIWERHSTARRANRNSYRLPPK